MKKNLLRVIMAVMALGIVSCDDDLENINVNPNQAEIVPTSNVFASATKQYMETTEDGFNSGRLTLPWMQYWAQTAYAVEDAFRYRETTATGLYNVTYFVATDLKYILDQNTNEATKGNAAAYGNNENQIAAARIMMAYGFYQLTNFFGDVPYYSYGNPQESFQALAIGDGTLSPVFADQQDIYTDILKELRESADMINENEIVFVSGDNIFNGDATKWKRFANSLILRVANNTNGVDAAAANAAIDAAITSGVMLSNDDNAVQAFDTADDNASPLWQAFIARTDFAVASTFVNLLQGETGTFGQDPRLFEMVAPTDAGITSVKEATYPRNTDYAAYEGMPYAFPNPDKFPRSAFSYASSKVIKPDYGEVLMEFAEVQFIISERNGFAQGNYIAGVTASMEKWGVSTADIATFVSGLPAANRENVLTQKYVALYMQGHTAYAEYRRTKLPADDIFILPNETVILPQSQVDALPASFRVTSYVFVPQNTDVTLTEMPKRLRYPQSLQTLNRENVQAASAKLSNGDVLNSPLFWDVN
ncbi:SusD/RagB family nutrient-binding outer membrane lipoprotein [Nonlabens antarcticus]|uniref:SusD/RagB family nutrient-binding outer membrane lipoprotein n=1 Tax=Nonlabens antarcticus TaxID=392714 RepID=UPI00189120DC|nr:SusD/RagB family nutrient-binding outer membrane lipoprotein [Nonlabens antarcticus]